MVILGLDGLPLSVARLLASSGRMPHLARLVNSGFCTAMRAELPELSPVNWTSFYTGCGPEEHGVFGFSRINPRTYALALADFTQVTIPTIYDRLGEAGFASRIINLPNTYPVRPLKGTMLVAGFVAPELSRAVYPPFLAARLQAQSYLLEADTTRGNSDSEYLLAQLRATLQSRLQALHVMWPDLAWDVFTLILTETDRLFHFLFDAVVRSEHALHAACMEFLQHWDAMLGNVLALYDALPEPKRLMVLADHGFTELRTEVDINAWLRRECYLYTAAPAGMQTELDTTGILSETRAFALDPGRIYLHTAERFARGRLSPQQAVEEARILRRGLLELTYNGEPVIKAVHTADELYGGSMRPYAPDLVCEPYPGFDLKAKLDRVDIFGHFGRTGTHTVDDAFFYDSQGCRPNSLRDTGQIVLRYFGIVPCGSTSFTDLRERKIFSEVF